jgi:hypothetical protein
MSNSAVEMPSDLADLVKYTSALADALGVSRQAVHTWQRRSDAPARKGGFWSIREWQDYMRKHSLAATQRLDRTTAVTEVCSLVMNNLPPQITRRRLHRLLARVETALHVICPGTRFRPATYIHAPSQENV